MTESANVPGKVIAFYSFKGGTGRSMALANIGCILAKQPLGSVLMVDWDLEAPGLHRYFRNQLFSAFRGVDEVQDKSPGLIDLFIEVQNRLGKVKESTPQTFDSAVEMVRELTLDDYVIKTDISNLHLLKAGRFDHEYAGKVGTFEWLDLYRRSPFLLRALADRFAREYRYVLIDSRTGLTDTSGICAMLMPEILVAVFTPNRQNLSGVIDLIREAGKYRSQSDDIRPLIVYPLPSRIEASEPALRKQWRFGEPTAGIEGFQTAFERAFKEIYALSECSLSTYFDDVQIQQVPRYAYGEEIAVIGEETRDRFSLTRSYQRFAGRLLSEQVPWEVAPDLEGDFTKDEPLNTTDKDNRKERAADAYLHKLTGRITRVRTIAKALSAAYTYLSTAGIVLIVSSVFVTTFLRDRYVFIEIGLMVGAVVIFAGIQLFALPRRSASLGKLVGELEQEMTAFKGKVPPYEGDDALQRLISRVEPILQSQILTSIKKSGRVFVSYRRADAAGYAGRLYDSLRNRIGVDKVFMDVDLVQPGEDFVDVLEKAVASADIVLAVIGPDWLAADSTGKRWVDDPTDFVRVELSAALRRNTRVVPILVRGAQMPSPSDLPPDLQGLIRRNALVLRDGAWDVDMLRLNEIIDQYRFQKGS